MSDQSHGKLALHGGPKTIDRPLQRYNHFTQEEVRAASAVIESGVLSRFVGGWNDDFYGGARVKDFERAWEKQFKTKHAITVNSATSGLIAAVGAVGVEPGDEVIVSPFTMSASATAILVWNAIPVFADIEPETFNLDPAAIRRAITPRTKAIMVPDIFGHAAPLDEIMAIAREHKLKVIEDNAQAPGALYKGRYVGCVADIGVFSLNYHKHIHTGEGGVCVTGDSVLAERMQLIRNHAEAVVADKPTTDYTNLIGFNFRLGEIEAAIGTIQLGKLPKLAARRTEVGAKLSEGLRGLEGLRTPVIKPDCTHVYYVYPLVFDIDKLGVPRDKIVAALAAEGVTALEAGYTNIHLLPIYQKRIAYGRKGFPWTPDVYKGDVSYAKGICPVAERFHDQTLMNIETCFHEYPDEDIALVVKAFRKVWANLDSLRA